MPEVQTRRARFVERPGPAEAAHGLKAPVRPIVVLTQDDQIRETRICQIHGRACGFTEDVVQHHTATGRADRDLDRIGAPDPDRLVTESDRFGCAAVTFDGESIGGWALDEDVLSVGDDAGEAPGQIGVVPDQH